MDYTKATSTSSLEEFVVSQLKCSSCCQPLRLPIRNCLRGDALCEFCYFNARNCSLCGSTKNTVRFYIVEKIFLIATFTCKWTRHGCAERHTGKTIGRHENACKFYQMKCPLRFDTNCDYVGTKAQIAFHCRIFHPYNSFSDNSVEIITTNYFYELSTRPHEFRREYYTIYLKDEIFRAVWEMNGSVARFSLNTIGQLSNPDTKYSFEVGFINKSNNRICLKLTNDCTYLKDDRIHFVDGNFVSADIDRLKRYCGTYGALYFTVKINGVVNGISTPLGNETDEWLYNLTIRLPNI